MHWECTECGSIVTHHHRPIRCPICGIAGALFVAAGTDPEDGVLDESFCQAWLDWGLHWTEWSSPDDHGRRAQFAA